MNIKYRVIKTQQQTFVIQKKTPYYWKDYMIFSYPFTEDEVIRMAEVLQKGKGSSKPEFEVVWPNNKIKPKKKKFNWGCGRD